MSEYKSKLTLTIGLDLRYFSYIQNLVDEIFSFGIGVRVNAVT